jgi:hypothetical protein
VDHFVAFDLAARSESHILRKMVFSRTSYARLMAAFLPVSFLWLFAACVTLCAPHSSEGEFASVGALSQAEVEASHESDCCPIMEATITALPERHLLAKLTDDAAQGLSTFTARPVSGNISCVLSPPLAFSSSDPPFERLRTLRI